jgi:hypothetical protein
MSLGTIATLLLGRQMYMCIVRNPSRQGAGGSTAVTHDFITPGKAEAL